MKKLTQWMLVSLTCLLLACSSPQDVSPAKQPATPPTEQPVVPSASAVIPEPAPAAPAAVPAQDAVIQEQKPKKEVFRRALEEAQPVKKKEGDDMERLD